MPKSRVHTERTCGESCRTSRSGFTLIELLIAISIIAILSAIGFTMYSVAMKQGRDSKRQSDLRTIQSALEQYYSDQGFYPFTQFGGIPFGLNELLADASQPPFTNRTGNPTSPAPQLKNYINSLPKDPRGVGFAAGGYIYVALPNNPIQCDNSVTNKCNSYCLYAKLDTLPSPDLKGCTQYGTYNFAVTPP